MKRTKQILSMLFALLLAISLLGCIRFADPVPDPVTPDSGIDAPVFTLEPTGTPLPDPTDTPIPEAETAAPIETPSETPTAEPAAAPTPEPTSVPTDTPTPEPTAAPTDTPCPVSEDGEYWTKDEVALYIHLFGHLPKNYITKEKAQELGWTGGSLEPYAPGCSIGGGYFGNYEGLLPRKSGRKYSECDIDTRGKKSRGAKRIVFSNDGLIYYTDDHYESFTLLYGEE